MGQEASKPQIGKSIQVIGAGLPRTGTASFSEALAIMYNGPVYHGGTQNTIGSESNVLGWINILHRTPIRSEADRKLVLNEIKALTNGYVAITDTPGHCFVEELMEIYPHAKVICTVRDVDKWVLSMDKVATASLQNFLRILLFWLPSLRYLPRYLDTLNQRRWRELYGPPREGETYVDVRQVWHKHTEYLKRTVPAEKLAFLDVKDGWEPLCKALDCPVPKGVEFPRINDSQAMEAFARKQIQRGLMRWAIAIGVACVLASTSLWFLQYVGMA